MKILADGHTYDFDMDALSNRDVMDLEDLLGVTMADWGARVSKGNPSAKDMTVLVWLARRQNGEAGLPFEDVVFSLGSFSVEGVEEGAVSADPADPTPGSPATPSEPSAENG